MQKGKPSGFTFQLHPPRPPWGDNRGSVATHAEQLTPGFLNLSAGTIHTAKQLTQRPTEKRENTERIVSGWRLLRE